VQNQQVNIYAQLDFDKFRRENIGASNGALDPAYDLYSGSTVTLRELN